ncbi:MAG: serine/threonine-protein kinase [Acidobacteria bacterium]|nr:serine/threonine-protein kinase [Acidobacteriota bacterium]
MTDQTKDHYQSIVLSGTDTELPAWFTNDYKKYSHFRAMAGGGNGLLVSCKDNNLGRTVALKKLRPGLSHSVRDRRRLLREARVTAQLQHPATVPVYEIGKDDEGQIYFAMKKIEGEDLFKILSRIARGDDSTVQTYTLNRLLGILIQASNALGYAHTHGVIHRDVKPENILVGFYGEVYLMDWGVAKIWGRPNDGPAHDEVTDGELRERLTTAGSRPGTPLYMSPEQVYGNRTIDERTDVFSMGVVLYEVLALREPFRGRTIEETFQNICNATPLPPSEIATHLKVPARLEDICLKAMQKEPRARYSSIMDMVTEITQFRDETMTDPTDA